MRNRNQLFDAAAALGFVISQTSHIEQQVNETVYPDIQYPSLIPVDTTAHPFAKSVTYYSSDKVGLADWINGNADDVPLASGHLSKHETMVHTAGIGYAYGWEEIEHARMLGIDLPNDDAMAARRAYEEMVDRVALEGDARKGFEGLFDYTGVPVQPATNGGWAAETNEDLILDDVNAALLLVHANTNTAVMANTVLMPWSSYLTLATRRIGDTNLTVLQFLMQNNLVTASTGQQLLIRGVRKLDTAGVSGTARMVVYRRDPSVLKMHIPMPHRFLPARQAGALRIEVPGVFRLGGLDIRRPKEVAYIDGL
jgi:hypothetical protein